MKVHSVNKVLYPLKFIQKTDIKKASIQNALILFFNFWNSYLTFILSKPSPNTPMTALCDTNAFGSISFIKRNIVVDSRFCQHKHHFHTRTGITTYSVNERHPR